MLFKVDQEYSKEVICNYNGDCYSVRDNGAVLRHSNGHERPLDNEWTFGRPSPEGYLFFSKNPVHRIVATAFIGEPPSLDYVVDHIDTNRQNNRPENLRWLTRLENILNNPITVSRILRICGSIESFLEDPSVLRNLDGSHSWMRRVTNEEAKNALDNLMRLSHIPRGEYYKWVSLKDSSLPKLLTLEQDNRFSSFSIMSYDFARGFNYSFCYNVLEEGNYSLVPAQNVKALQYGWQSAICFESCPSSVGAKPLEDYHSKLGIGSCFIKRQLFNYVISETFFSQDHRLLFVCSKILFHADEIDDVWNLTVIGYREGKFIHQNLHFYFNYSSVIDVINFARTIQPDCWIYKHLVSDTSSVNSTSEDFISVWKDILIKYRGKPRIYSILNGAEFIEKEDRMQIIVHAQNDAQRKWIQSYLLSDIESSLSSQSVSVVIVME